MPTLIAYTKVIDAITTHTLRLPQGQGTEPAAQELCTLPDGRTVVVLFSGTLPTEQPAAIEDGIATLPTPLPDDLRAAICAASPAVRLINARVVESIRQRYSADDEIKLLRIAPCAETATWNAYAEECRAMGRTQKAALGLA